MATIERLHRTAPLDLAKLEEDVVRESSREQGGTIGADAGLRRA